MGTALRALVLLAVPPAAAVLRPACPPSRPAGAPDCPGATAATTALECSGLGFCCNGAPGQSGVGCYAMDVRPFEGLACSSLTFVPGTGCDCNTEVQGATVVLEGGDDANALDCTACPPGIAATYVNDAGLGWSLQLRGLASLDAYAAAIASVAFRQTQALVPTADGCGHPHAVRWNFGPARYRHELDGHLYGVVEPYGRAQTCFDLKSDPVLADACTWGMAQRTCADPARDILGLVGYLATHADPAEYRYVARPNTETAFVGRTDADVEGEWRWVTGPEGCPDAYDPAAADHFLRSGCDLQLTNVTTTFDPCVGASCGKGTLVGVQPPPPYTARSFISAPNQMPWDEASYPHDIRQWTNTRLTGQDYGRATANAQVDSPYKILNSRLPVHVCEWGGVGTLCVSPDSLSQRVEIDTLPSLACPTLNECVADCPTCERGVCDGHTPEQRCRDTDPDPSSVGDWECRCSAPGMAGAGYGAAAVCYSRQYYDECTEVCTSCENDKCNAAGQLCIDPIPSAPARGDWLCRCPFSVHDHSDTQGALADCVLDECDSGRVRRAVCAAADPPQACTDPSTSVLHDWVCSCGAPLTGFAVAAVSACSLDECTAVCHTCAGTNCSQAAQACVDPDMAVNATSDWMCVCILPEVGTAVARTAVCILDECAQTCGTCEKGACAAAAAAEASEQRCNDTDTDASALNTWVCMCVAPFAGQAPTIGASCLINECDAVCGTCANATCSDAAPPQACREPNASPTSLRDWICACLDPLNGTAGQTAASCDLDECAATCASCSKGTCANAVPPQQCDDPDISPAALSDWACLCPPPYAGNGTALPAVCTLDECSASCSTCAGGVCAAAVPSQLCNDPDITHTALADWTCRCVPPFSGVQTNSTARCALDECAATCNTCADGVCIKAVPPQACDDPVPFADTRSDWTCSCVAPAQGAPAVGVPAACVLDECTAACGTCAAGACPAGQACLDANMSAAALLDWECVCHLPAAGRATGAPAVCVLEECTAVCATCANRTCDDVGQPCTDRNPLATSLGDWQCDCPAPFITTTPVQGGAAKCEIDECSNVTCGTCANATCSDAGQTCEDADHDSSALLSWVCACPPPFAGAASAQPATCLLDECTGRCLQCAVGTCSAAQQTCADDHPGTLGDWECRCVPPSVGAPAVADVALCALDECAVSASGGIPGGMVCGDAQQSCEDLDVHVPDTWRCVCIPPQTGATAGGAARCSLDECATNHTCASCANGTCAAAQQECREGSTLAHALGDWECVCHPPLQGVAVGRAAVCLLDECDVSLAQMCTTCENGVCRAAQQRCTDVSTLPADTGDWVCSCPVPFSGEERGAPAACVVDECEATCASCENDACGAGVGNQTCSDPSTSWRALRDWTCTCPAPATGAAVGAAAVCAVDECTASCSSCANGTCQSANVQTCHDPSPSVTSLWDWECRCILPTLGAAPQAAADCVLDECEVECAHCEKGACEGGAAPQACSDPDTTPSAIWDWVCTCQAPYSGRKTGARAACTYDECDVWGQVCTDVGQECVDVHASLTGDWECHCTGQYHGAALNAPAACTLSECDLSHCPPSGPRCPALVCSAVGQNCYDPDSAATATDDWECQCIAPTVGAQRGAPALCKLDECEHRCMMCTAHACSGCDAAGAPSATVCMAHGQACEDIDVRAESLRDWQCVCQAPTVGRAEGAPADCLEYLDECLLEGVQCRAAGQECDDPEPVVSTRGDWRCLCTPPSARHAVARPATAADCSPEFDECVVAPGDCTLVTGCAAVAYDGSCRAAAQRCEDPQPTADSLGDWRCACDVAITPVGGVPVAYRSSSLKRPAACTFDECAAGLECPSCGGGAVCERAGQTCVDPTPGAAPVLGDWVCRCSVAAGAGAAVGRAVDRCSDSPSPSPSPSPAPSQVYPPGSGSGTPAPLKEAAGEDDGGGGTITSPMSADQKTAVGGAVVGGTAAALFAGGAAATAATQLAVLATDCSITEDPLELPFVLHPTRVRFSGSAHLGALVMNVLLVILVAMGALVVTLALKRCLSRGVVQSDAFGFTRFPSAPLFVVMFFFQSIMLCGASVILYAPSRGPPFAAPVLGVAALILFGGFIPFKTARKLRRSVPDRATYTVDLRTTERPWLTFVIGAGEWVSTSPDLHFVHRWRSVLHPWKQDAVLFCVADMLASAALGLMASIRPTSWAQCGHIKSVQAVVCLLMIAVTYTQAPHNRARDNVTRMAVNGLLAGGLVCMAAGYYMENPLSQLFASGGQLYLVATGLLLLKAIFDIGTEAYIWRTRRRRRLQEEAFADVLDASTLSEDVLPQPQPRAMPDSSAVEMKVVPSLFCSSAEDASRLMPESSRTLGRVATEDISDASCAFPTPKSRSRLSRASRTRSASSRVWTVDGEARLYRVPESLPTKPRRRVDDEDRMSASAASSVVRAESSLYLDATSDLSTAVSQPRRPRSGRIVPRSSPHDLPTPRPSPRGVRRTFAVTSPRRQATPQALLSTPPRSAHTHSDDSAHFPRFPSG